MENERNKKNNKIMKRTTLEKIAECFERHPGSIRVLGQSFKIPEHFAEDKRFIDFHERNMRIWDLNIPEFNSSELMRQTVDSDGMLRAKMFVLVPDVAEELCEIIKRNEIESKQEDNGDEPGIGTALRLVCMGHTIGIGVIRRKFVNQCDKWVCEGTINGLKETFTFHVRESEAGYEITWSQADLPQQTVAYIDEEKQNGKKETQQEDKYTKEDQNTNRYPFLTAEQNKMLTLACKKIREETEDTRRDNMFSMTKAARYDYICKMIAIGEKLDEVIETAKEEMREIVKYAKGKDPDCLLDLFTKTLDQDSYISSLIEDQRAAYLSARSVMNIKH